MTRWVSGVVVACGLMFGTGAAAEDGWTRIDYGPLVDLRELSHSGEPVGVLLERLDGRDAPPPGERIPDRLAHGLLDPLLEPYAFVLSDVLDWSVRKSLKTAWVEIGSLYGQGGSEPVWVEMLRSRRYVVESDGRGRFRLALPWPGEGTVDDVDPVDAARAAYEDAWPLIRHVFAAEKRRLGDAGEEPVLEVTVFAYVHQPARTEYRIGGSAFEAKVVTTVPDGTRPPLDLATIRDFLAAGLQLEGGRLEPGGELRLLGSRTPRRPSMLGRPVALSDLAVAFRAVFRGGLAEPYMSLDRGFSPQTSIVNYGGRLRDTSLGMVSLLCDVRFKTFSLGLDIRTGTDVRELVRGRVPDFRTHLERFAFHPEARGVTSQQTRLWFYPDKVDLTLSPQGDLLAMRRVRMSAASERFDATQLSGGESEVPPWTRETVQGIDLRYDRLSRFFPELGDLDQVVRLLSFFTWLQGAQRDGLLIPELDVLWSLELPSIPTERTFPQLLAYNALPAEQNEGLAVDVFDRVAVGEALERLNPTDRPLPARRRLSRALAALDPDDDRNRALYQQVGRHDLETAKDTVLDFLAFRAERLRMHQTVLATLHRDGREKLQARTDAGESVRSFSVGIGGLDLGMGQALDRARERAAGGVASDVGEPGRAVSEPREEWKRDPDGLTPRPLPDHGEREGGDVGPNRVARGEDSTVKWIWTLYGADSPEVRSRRVLLDKRGRPTAIERVERRRFLRYTLERSGSDVRVIIDSPSALPSEMEPAASAMPDRLAVLNVQASDPASLDEKPTIQVRLDGSFAGNTRSLPAEVPRPLFQRLVAGPSADLHAGQPIVGLAPLTPAVGDVHTVMVMMDAFRKNAPWRGATPVLPGEEDPPRLARALSVWWSEVGEPHFAVVGTGPEVGVDRWARAPALQPPVTLVLPPDGFPGPFAPYRERLAGAWNAGPVVDGLDARPAGKLVVLISAEAPGEFAKRLRQWAESPQMKGRYLAAWPLLARVRADLPSALLDAGNLAGFGLAEGTIVGTRDTPGRLAGFAARIGRVMADGGRIETSGEPFLWYF